MAYAPASLWSKRRGREEKTRERGENGICMKSVSSSDRAN